MKRKSVLSLLLALILTLSLTACGGSKANVQTATTREEVKAMADAFYGSLLTADPIRMTTVSDGQTVSVFTKAGDAMCSDYPDMDVTYYAFKADGTKYTIYDGENAYAEDYMYDLLEQSVELTLTMMVTGVLEAEVGEEGFTYEAKKTDTADGSELVYTLAGEQDGQQVKLTVTGNARPDGKVTDIAYEAVVGEETQAIGFKFEYEGVTVTIPDYVIQSDEIPEFDHVESPFATIQEVIDALGEDEFLQYQVYDGVAYVIGEKDGRHYQLSAPMSQEDQAAYDALDFFDDDYDQKVYDIIGKLSIDDAVDFTDGVLSPEELQAFAGGTVQDMVDSGFECTGWSASEEGIWLSMDKDYMTYDVQVVPGDDFDPDAEFELENIMGNAVESVEFVTIESYILPLP